MAEPLDKRHLADLHALAAELGIERYRMLTRSDLVAAILERDPDAAEAGAAGEQRTASPARSGRRRRSSRSRDESGSRPEGKRAEEDESDREADEEEAGEPVSGILDVTPRGHGFIRRKGLDSDEEDVYVSPSQIRRCEMQRGDEVAGPVRAPRRGERYPALIHVDTINGVAPGGEDRVRLADATAVHPTRRIALHPAPGVSADETVLLRAVDLLAPLARGQRVLVEAAPGAGRTTLLRSLARAVDAVDDLDLVVLLIDERPEEVEAWRAAAPGAELAVATGEMRSGEQLRLVELAFGRASRRAEAGADVVLLVDSISRIAVAADDPGRAKPIFGAGRETAEEGVGSLTVVATTLGARGEDEGGVQRALETTETVRIALDPDLAAAGTFPALAVAAARVAAEDQLRSAEELDAIRRLRASLAELAPAEAARELRRRIEETPDNVALIAKLADD